MRSPNHYYYIRRLNFCKLLLGLRKARPNLLQFFASFSPSRTRDLFPRLKGTKQSLTKFFVRLCCYNGYKLFLKRNRQTKFTIVITAMARSEICHIRDIGITAPIKETKQKITVKSSRVVLLFDM